MLIAEFSRSIYVDDGILRHQQDRACVTLGFCNSDVWNENTATVYSTSANYAEIYMVGRIAWPQAILKTKLILEYFCGNNK
jgi:hypothetical protein